MSAKKLHYNVRWHRPTDLALCGNVSFEAISDHHAKIQADKIGRELGVGNIPRTLTRRDKPGVLVK